MSDETVAVTFHLSIGLVGCEIRRTEDIPIEDLPEDETEREKYLWEYAQDVLGDNVDIYWRIEPRDE